LSRRIERLNEQFRREITEILQTAVKDPRVGYITVTEARVAPDLSFARVYVRKMGEEKEQEEALVGLSKAAPYIRHELGKRLKLRQIPELKFEADKALEYGLHIEKLLRDIPKPTDD